jgi:preprotein translocase subunit SecA
MEDAERRLAYGADVTYATNSEIGFDYLRDNMKPAHVQRVQRPFSFAIVDEVDSILIDEARTPLIISGPGPDLSSSVALAHRAVSSLTEADWKVDIKRRSVSLTDDGLYSLERALAAEGAISPGGHLHDTTHMGLVPFVHAALRARVLFIRDKDYIVRDGEVIIIDENTGRTMAGRRYHDGLHQALEAKEGVQILPETHTMASITYQNFFRLYPKLSGMTGTAMTEADEFAEIYNLSVVDIPTNAPCIRDDAEDEVYCTEAEKFAAVVSLIGERHRAGQPMLVGTASIERSETLSAMLSARGIPHSVLNARQHSQEARIVAQAGRPGAVTISTNMAGRGTDIKLGGNADFLISEVLSADAGEAEREELRAQIVPQVEAAAREVCRAGGLLVIGTERHESRRVDDQLRGRSGRQGDPGASRFFASFEDDLMRRFGGPRMSRMLASLGLQPGEPITHPWVSRAVRKAQQKIEEQNFDIRKNLLKYDDPVNQQRKAFYRQRNAILDGSEDVGLALRDLRQRIVAEAVSHAMPAHAFPEQWDTGHLASVMKRVFDLTPPVAEWAAEEGVGPNQMAGRLGAAVETSMAGRFGAVPASLMADIERQVLIQSIDNGWKEHLADLDVLREGIGLRSYGQLNPLYEWQSEVAAMFTAMFARSTEQTLAVLSRITVAPPPPPGCPSPARAAPDAAAAGEGGAAPLQAGPLTASPGRRARHHAVPACWPERATHGSGRVHRCLPGCGELRSRTRLAGGGGKNSHRRYPLVCPRRRTGIPRLEDCD